MKPVKFNEFITEETKVKKFRLLIITDEPEEAKEFHTADRLREEADKKGYKSYLYKLSGGYMTLEDSVRRVHNKKDKKGFEISAETTVAVIRGSITRKDSWMDLISQLEKAGIVCVNSRQTISTCADKYRTSLRLADVGLRQPKTVLVSDPDNIQEAFEQLDTDFPIILKTLRGSKGVGVLFVESEKSLTSLVQVLYKQDEDSDLLLQEYIETEYDARVHVLGGKVIAAMRRDVLEGDFRSNISQGAKAKELKLTDLEIEKCIEAAKAVGGLWTGVDFIPAKNREKDEPFFIEVNSSAGTEGVEDATNRNISKEIIEYFEDRDNWVYVPAECGFKETIRINGVDFVAKFDTGNSGQNVIHGEDVNIQGKKVSWKLLGKKYTADLIRMDNIKVGGLRDYDEDRPLIKLDVEFAGTIYTDTLFTIDDREDRTPILLDRKFMKRLNVMVNPARKYLLTTPFDVDIRKA
tara:strand:- start:56 stop:1450 length:1395 start_codon:yes stop_codon:yes gene_type:complete